MPSAETHARNEAVAPRSAQGLLDRRHVELGQRSLRQHAARGVIITSGVAIAMALLLLGRGLVVGRFITRADYGVWGVVITTVMTLMLLKQVGVDEKFIQQDADDEELAFQRAFTIEVVLNAVFLVVLLVAAPVVTLAYGRDQLLAPMLLMALLVPAYVLMAPTWILIRRMRWRSARWLTAVEPLVGSAVAIALAAAGLGYWSLVAGALVGAWSGACVALIISPHRLAWRFDSEQFRSYFQFSWPLLVVNASALVVAQAAFFFGNDALGLVGAGAIALSTTISQFSTQVDEIVSRTMYPVICAVQDRVDLLYESFVKSNRLALMWAVPFGLALTIFAPDLVRFGIGERWHAAIPLLQVFGVFAAVGHFGFNWDDYFRARGETTPIAWAATLTTLSFLVTAIPLLYVWGLKGLAVAVAVQTVVNLLCRAYFLRGMFDGFDMLKHAARASAPAVPAVLAVLVLRALERGSRTGVEVALELVLYAAIIFGATWWAERRLLTEIAGYVRAR